MNTSKLPAVNSAWSETMLYTVEARRFDSKKPVVVWSVIVSEEKLKAIAKAAGAED